MRSSDGRNIMIKVISHNHQVKRIETDNTDPRSKPIVVSFVNQADKWEILCLARYSNIFNICLVICEISRVTKMTNVSITEDLTSSRYKRT